MIKVSLRKKVIGICLLFLILFFLAACEKDQEVNSEVDINPTSTPVPTADVALEEEIEEESEEEEYALRNFVFPASGVRPYAVMIDNAGPRTLPQGGLHLAQIIYEIIVEGGETRFMPLFWEQDATMIGPVRSSRHYFLDYVMEHDAIYAHIGWSPMAQRDISTFGISNINGAGDVFWKLTKDRNNWQDTYTSMERLKNYVDRTNFRKTTEVEQVFKYSDKPVELLDGKDAEKIKLTYSWVMSSSFTYDPEKKIYLRDRRDAPHMERVSEEQLTAKNIIVQKVRNYPIKDDYAGRQEVVTVGSGEGYYITNGKYIEITWSKGSRREKTRYLDKEGNEILLNPGQTWIQIFPTTAKVEITNLDINEDISSPS
ncbi:UNVERIFIED_CONTAM: Protein of unknown function (DUF3048) [Acetivibrio alkalicellulosi]